MIVVEDLSRNTEPSTRVIHISFSLSLFLSSPPVIQSLPSHRPLANPLILLPLGSIVCMAPQLYVPTTATSPLFPPALNCHHRQVLVANLALMSPSKDRVVILSARNLNLELFGTEETGESGELLAAV